MKVSELIEILQKMPPGILVMVNGYEGGIGDLKPENVRATNAVLNEHKNCAYYGPHAESEDVYYPDWEPQPTIVPVVLLGR